MSEIRRMREDDLAQVNAVFTKAFSHARIDEGLKQHRVSPCRIAFLKMYLGRSGAGAIVATDRDQVVGFNFNHMFGTTGWMGPLAVLPKYQGVGVGKEVVRGGVEYLREQGATVIGLETMPRNFRNIGFYTKLGFDPGPLCLDMVSPTHDGPPSLESPGGRVVYFRESPPAEQESLIRGCGEVSAELASGLDYAGEVRLNAEHSFGDTVFLVEGKAVVGFAICHLEPYGQFEERREVKISVLALRPGSAVNRLSALLGGVKDLAAREKLSVVRLHLRADKWGSLRSLLSWGYNVGYSDLRMCLSGFVEKETPGAIHFCRWQ
jgi:ribosomal protein S18 acetylase RimI-like enzyme